MQHKAFWVHNSETTLPNISAFQQTQSHNTSQELLNPNDSLVQREIAKEELDRRVHDGYDPVPINKTDQLVSPEKEKGDMKLAQ